MFDLNKIEYCDLTIEIKNGESYIQRDRSKIQNTPKLHYFSEHEGIPESKMEIKNRTTSAPEVRGSKGHLYYLRVFNEYGERPDNEIINALPEYVTMKVNLKYKEKDDSDLIEENVKLDFVCIDTQIPEYIAQYGTLQYKITRYWLGPRSNGVGRAHV